MLKRIILNIIYMLGLILIINGIIYTNYIEVFIGAFLLGGFNGYIFDKLKIE